MNAFISISGIGGFIAIGLVLILWVAFWFGMTMIVGAMFSLPTPMSAAAGAILGPLGLVAVLFVGAAQKKPQESMKRAYASVTDWGQSKRGPKDLEEDPFA